MDIIYRPIGIIHSPFKDLAGMPIQPSGESTGPGAVKILPEYEPGLKDLDGFSREKFKQPAQMTVSCES
jgi:tRNA (Thr-GGU) A37 N-methylase